MHYLDYLLYERGFLRAFFTIKKKNFNVAITIGASWKENVKDAFAKLYEQIGKSFKKTKVPVKIGLSSKTRFEFMKEDYEKTFGKCVNANTADQKKNRRRQGRTRSGKKRTNTETESQVTKKKKPRGRKASSVARPRFGKKGLEHVDVRVLGDRKSQDAISRLLMEAQSHLTSILEGLRGFAIHNDRERIRSLLSKYRTKQIVLIRPKVKSSANDNVKPDVELQGASGEALRHVVEKVKTRYQLEAQGFELETVSWVFVPPCAPPQSFHQDYEPSLIPSIRDVNVEMGTILHLQAESKSTSSLVSFT